ncbi:MAG: DUF11 domain-containing protein [Phycisphaerales bacterium]|nr:MAG: DUF11 domain-containing protein [Phycisphaerales bacterium]
MTKLLNILLILSTLLLLGVSGCSGLCGAWSTDEAEAPRARAAVRDDGAPPVSTADPKQTSSPADRPIFVSRPSSADSQETAITESGLYLVSRVYPCAECGAIRLEKVLPKEVELTKPFDYSIKVTNLTDMTLAGVAISETLPPNFRSTGADPTARIDANMLVWEIPSLAPKDSNHITVSGFATDTNPHKHCTRVVTPVIPACASVKVVHPRLQLAKTAPAEASLCDPIPVKFVVTNTGTGSADGVRIVDSLADGVQTHDGKSELVLNAGTLNAGDSRQFEAELRATKTGSFTSKATASSKSGLSAESGQTTTIVGQPLLTISQTGPERQYLGRPVTYEITVTNKGDISAKNTVIECAIPSGVTSIKATAGAKLTGSSIVWEIGTLTPNGSRAVRVSYSPTQETTITNKATANAYCAESVTALAKTDVTAIPAVLLEVIDVEDPIEVGGSTTYVITVTNQGSATDSNISITCTLEDNMTYVSSTGATGASVDGATVQFAPLANLGPKAKATWRVVVEAVKPGDVRFKVTMNTDQLTRSVEETEATRVYK